jgi:hypothetical protein
MVSLSISAQPALPQAQEQTLALGVFKTRMAHPSIASRGPGTRRAARGIAPVARRHKDVPSGDCRARGVKRRGHSRHPGVLSLGDFSLHEQRQFRRERNWTRFSAPRRGPRQGWRGSKVTRPRCGNRN